MVKIKLFCRHIWKDIGYEKLSEYYTGVCKLDHMTKFLKYQRCVRCGKNRMKASKELSHYFHKIQEACIDVDSLFQNVNNEKHLS